MPRLIILILVLGAAAFARAASLEDRVELLFRPPTASMAVLSPDGRRVAFTAEGAGDLRLVTLSLEPPGSPRTLKVEGPHDPMTAEEYPPGRLRFLRWATTSRLVYAPAERAMPLAPVVDKAGHATPNPDGPVIFAPVFVVDVDGKERGTLVDAREFQETPDDVRRTLADLLRTPIQLAAVNKGPVRWRMPHLDILGFLPQDREELIILTHGAYSKPSQHLVDLRTGDIRDFGGDWPLPPGEPQVFDWQRLKVVGERQEGSQSNTAWSDPELAQIQRELERKFSRRVVEILDWSETRLRVLFRVTGGSDAGRLFLLQRPDDLVTEILQCAPWLPATKLNETRYFECPAPDGTKLTGYITWPAKSSTSAPPLLVVFPSGFPGHRQPGFDPEAQVFADMGFAVARLNHRSFTGVAAHDLTALRAAVDQVSVADARTTIDWLAQRNPNRSFDRDRVVALGRGFGGYVAVRALQLRPAMFRAAIAIDAPMDLQSWLKPSAPGRGGTPTTKITDIPATLIDHAGIDWKRLSVVEHADALTSPVLLAFQPGRNPTIDHDLTNLRNRLMGLGRPPEVIEIDPAFATARTESRVRVYEKIQAFINRHIGGGSATAAPAKAVE